MPLSLVHELGSDQLEVLRKTFLSDGGLSQLEFATAVLELLPPAFTAPARRLETTQALCDLFVQLDVSAGDFLTWEALSASLIDTGPVDEAARAPGFRWAEREEFAHRSRLPLAISRVRTISELQLVCVCEEGTRSVQLYNAFGPLDSPDAGLTRVGEIDTTVGGSRGGGGVFDVAYDAASGVLLLAVGDFSLQFWDARPLLGRLVGQAAAAAAAATSSHSNLAAFAPGAEGPPAATALTPLTSPQFMEAIHCPTPQHLLCWLPEADKLLTAGSRAPEILVWHVRLSRRDGWAAHADLWAVHKGSLTVHGQRITALEPLRNVGLVASASQDGSIALWAIQGMMNGSGSRRGLGDGAEEKFNVLRSTGAASSGVSLHRRHKAAHRNGVRALAYLPSVRMLFSGGYGTAVQAWDLLVDDGLTPAYRLSGHAAGVVDLVAVDGGGDSVVGGGDAPAAVDASNIEGDGTGAEGGLGDGDPQSKRETGSEGAAETEEAAATAAQTDPPPPKPTVRCIAELLSVDDSGEVRWWTSTREAGVLDFKRCLQVWRPRSVQLSDQGFTAQALVLLRPPVMAAYSAAGSDGPSSSRPASAALPLPSGADAQASSITNASATRRVQPLEPVEVRLAFDEALFTPGLAQDDGDGIDGGVMSTAAHRLRSASRTMHESVRPVHHTMPRLRGAQASGGDADMQRNGAVLLLLGAPVPKCFEAERLEEDRAVAVACIFHAPSETLLAASGTDIRVLDGPTGALLRVHRSVLPGDALAGTACFDASRRKLIIACGGGAVVALNAASLRRVKMISPHVGDVTALRYCEEDRAVITIGWDGALQISDERDHVGQNASSATPSAPPLADELRRSLMRRVKHAHGRGVPLTALATDHLLNLVATGAADGSIRVWDFQDVTLIATLRRHQGEISGLAFTPPFPLLVAVDVLSLFSIWSVVRGSPASCVAVFPYAQLLRGGLSLLSATTTGLISAYSVAPLFSSCSSRVTALSVLPGTYTAAMHAKPARPLLASDSSAVQVSIVAAELQLPASAFPSIVCADDSGRILFASLQPLLTRAQSAPATQIVAPPVSHRSRSSRKSGAAGALARHFDFASVVAMQLQQQQPQQQLLLPSSLPPGFTPPRPTSGSVLSFPTRLDVLIAPVDPATSPPFCPGYHPHKRIRRNGARALPINMPPISSSPQIPMTHSFDATVPVSCSLLSCHDSSLLTPDEPTAEKILVSEESSSGSCSDLDLDAMAPVPKPLSSGRALSSRRSAGQRVVPGRDCAAKDTPSLGALAELTHVLLPSVSTARLSTPSSRLPFVPSEATGEAPLSESAGGCLLVSSSIVHAHGRWLRADADAAAAAESPSDLGSFVGREGVLDDAAWSGSGVTSLSVVDTPVLRAVVSCGEDGIVHMCSWEGAPLGILSLASGWLGPPVLPRAVRAAAAAFKDNVVAAAGQSMAVEEPDASPAALAGDVRAGQAAVPTSSVADLSSAAPPRPAAGAGAVLRTISSAQAPRPHSTHTEVPPSSLLRGAADVTGAGGGARGTRLRPPPSVNSRSHDQPVQHGGPPMSHQSSLVILSDEDAESGGSGAAGAVVAAPEEVVALPTGAASTCMMSDTLSRAEGLAPTATPKHVVLLGSPEPCWAPPLDRASQQRQRLLVAAAVLTRIETLDAKARAVEAAVALQETSSVGYEALKAFERRRRRSSIAAVAAFVEPGYGIHAARVRANLGLTTLEAPLDLANSGAAARKGRRRVGTVAAVSAAGALPVPTEVGQATASDTADAAERATLHHNRNLLIGQLSGIHTWIPTHRELAQERSVRLLDAVRRRSALDLTAHSSALVRLQASMDEDLGIERQLAGDDGTSPLLRGAKGGRGAVLSPVRRRGALKPFEATKAPAGALATQALVTLHRLASAALHSSSGGLAPAIADECPHVGPLGSSISADSTEALANGGQDPRLGSARCDDDNSSSGDSDNGGQTDSPLLRLRRPMSSIHGVAVSVDLREGPPQRFHHGAASRDIGTTAAGDSAAALAEGFLHGSPSHPPAQLPLIAVAAEGRRSAFDTPSRVAYPALAGELQRLSLSSPSDAGQRGIPSMAAAIDKATQHEANLLRHQLELNAREAERGRVQLSHRRRSRAVLAAAAAASVVRVSAEALPSGRSSSLAPARRSSATLLRRLQGLLSERRREEADDAEAERARATRMSDFASAFSEATMALPGAPLGPGATQQLESEEEARRSARTRPMSAFSSRSSATTTTTMTPRPQSSARSLGAGALPPERCRSPMGASSPLPRGIPAAGCSAHFTPTPAPARASELLRASLASGSGSAGRALLHSPLESRVPSRVIPAVGPRRSRPQRRVSTAEPAVVPRTPGGHRERAPIPPAGSVDADHWSLAAAQAANTGLRGAAAQRGGGMRAAWAATALDGLLLLDGDATLRSPQRAVEQKGPGAASGQRIRDETPGGSRLAAFLASLPPFETLLAPDTVAAQLRARNPGLHRALDRLRTQRQCGTDFRSLSAEQMLRLASANADATAGAEVTVSLGFSGAGSVGVAARKASQQPAFRVSYSPVGVVEDPSSAVAAQPASSSSPGMRRSASHHASSSRERQPPSSSIRRDSWGGHSGGIASLPSQEASSPALRAVQPPRALLLAAQLQLAVAPPPLKPRAPLDAVTYGALMSRPRVGGIPMRDVVAFREMCARVDRGRRGTIPFDDFVREVNSSHSTVQHLHKSLEAAFLAADAGGAGALTLPEFAAVMFPRARPEALLVRGVQGSTGCGRCKDIVTFITYAGPTLASRAPPPAPAAVSAASGVASASDSDSAEALLRLRALFDAHDLDGDGRIDQTELQRALAEALAGAAAAAAAAEDEGGGMRRRERRGGASELERALRDEGDDVDFEAFARVLGPLSYERA